MRINAKWIGLASLMAVVPCAAHAQAVLTVRTLSFGAALDAATTALDQCRKNGGKQPA
jgi:hypothetical protein